MTMPTFTDGTLVHQASLNSLSTGINNLSSYLLGAVPPRTYLPYAALHQSAAQSIPTNADTLLNFDTADVNNDNMWVSSANNQLTVQTAGTYAVFAQASFVGNATSDRYLFILMNGTSTSTNAVAEDHQAGLNAGDGNLLHCSAFLPSLAAGATLYLSVWQGSGGALNTVAGRSTPRFYAWRIGP